MDTRGVAAVVVVGWLGLTPAAMDAAAVAAEPPLSRQQNTRFFLPGAARRGGFCETLLSMFKSDR
jgi:hypothetical protein